MIGAGIHDGDMLIVDRSITASDGRIVIAVLNGELTVKRFKLLGRTAQLHSENSKYTPITLHEGCLLYTSPSPRDQRGSRMPSSA